MGFCYTWDSDRSSVYVSHRVQSWSSAGSVQIQWIGNSDRVTSCGSDAGRNDHSRNSRDTIRNMLDGANQG